MPTTSITPTHTPALKMSPISSQLLSPVSDVSASSTGKNEYFFIVMYFSLPASCKIVPYPKGRIGMTFTT